MFTLLKIALILTSCLAGIVESGKSCRQCTGTLRIVFSDYVSLEVAKTFIQRNLDNCVTRAAYLVDSVVAVYTNEFTCYAANKYLACTEWTYKITAWRYCGNGGSVALKRGQHCIDRICVNQDDLNLTCTRSVECKGDCDCSKCGC